MSETRTPVKLLSMKRKLYNGPVIEVDPQISKWRRKLVRMGLKKRRKPRGPNLTTAERELRALQKIRAT